MLIIWTFLCELPEILTLVSTCSCFKPVVAYFKRNFMRVNFIGSSHIYYHKSNYLSLTTILTHRAEKKESLNRHFVTGGIKPEKEGYAAPGTDAVPDDWSTLG